MEARNEDRIVIRSARIDDWENVKKLAWNTFLKYEAEDYGVEGTRSFREFLDDEKLHRMFLLGEYIVFIATYKDELLGMISLRSQNHISLLFVAEHFQHMGIGSALIRWAEHYLHKDMGEDKITVDAAPYAVECYHGLGYQDVDVERCIDGIRFTSMEKIF